MKAKPGSSIRSGKVVAAVALALLVATVCIRLGFWQLDRLDTRRAYNAQVSAAMDRPVILLDSGAVAELFVEPDSFAYRIAVARGVYLHEHDLLLRGRSDEGRPGVHLITPLQLESGQALLVNRGWLPAPDAATVDPRPYQTPAPVAVRGILHPAPIDIETETPVLVDVGGATVVTNRRLDHAERARVIGRDLPHLYLQLLPDDSASGLPRPVPAPTLDEGPHLGYAIQWFGLAAVAIVGLLIVGVRSRS